MIKRAIAGALLAIATSAAAADWHYLTGNTRGSEVYYDASSIQRTGDIARIWVKIDHLHDRSTRARMTIELWSYNCSARTTLAISTHSYLANGQGSGQREEFDIPMNYTPVVPESVAETAMLLACGDAPPRP